MENTLLKGKLADNAVHTHMLMEEVQSLKEVETIGEYMTVLLSGGPDSRDLTPQK